MKRNILSAIILGAIFPFSAPVIGDNHQAAATDAKSAAQLVEGEVRKVDMDAKKLTIRHGPIQNLDMPAMTMVFQVRDPALLDKVKAGDKIKFAADNVGGAYTVNQLEVVK